MKKRELGKSGLYVGDIGLVCMGFVHAAGKVTPKADAVRVIRAALERGVTMLDTAECYVGDDGHGGLIYSEEYVGEGVKRLLAGDFEANPRSKSSCSYCPVSGCERRLS